MKNKIRATLVLLFALSGLTGLAYPLMMTAIAQVFFPEQANGSVMRVAGVPVGSKLIGQSFVSPQYFWGRLSATGPQPYTALNLETRTGSSGSNLGPLNAEVADVAAARLESLRKTDPGLPKEIPIDLITASASGLDPHISPAAARLQIPRVAQARGLTQVQVGALLAQYTELRSFGMLGEARVNVLQLNLALDALRFP